jgi:hypothetical protein
LAGLPGIPAVHLQPGQRLSPLRNLAQIVDKVNENPGEKAIREGRPPAMMAPFGQAIK